MNVYILSCVVYMLFSNATSILSLSVDLQFVVVFLIMHSPTCCHVTGVRYF